MRQLILLAGASGSGKSRVTRLSGGPWLNLDDFYFDADRPGLPTVAGRLDWDDVRSWDAEAAVRTLRQLCATGRAEIPVYDIAASRAVGTRPLDLGEAGALVAEGVFAPELIHRCREAGMPVRALYLDRPRAVTLVLRFFRDVREHRKPLPVLIRRGLALWRQEPAIRHHALDRGCEPLSPRTAIGIITAAVQPIDRPQAVARTELP